MRATVPLTGTDRRNELLNRRPISLKGSESDWRLVVGG